METVYEDGAVAGACPHWDESESLEMAEVLGFGDDLWEMTRCHEICHTLTALVRGEKHSLVLWNVAHRKGKRWPHGGLAEETRAFALQKYLATGQLSAELRDYTEADLFAIHSFIEAVF